MAGYRGGLGEGENAKKVWTLVVLEKEQRKAGTECVHSIVEVSGNPILFVVVCIVDESKQMNSFPHVRHEPMHPG